jgi:VCBS repeat-containing protein
VKSQGFHARTRRSALPALAVLLAAGFVAASGPAPDAVAKPGQAKAFQQFTSDVPIALPDPDIPFAEQGDPYPSTIDVAGLAGEITDIDVVLSALTHSNPDDVDLLLVGPEGQTALFMSDAGGTADAAVTLTFDDEAASALPDGSSLENGAFRPTNFGGGDELPAPAPAPGANTALSVFDGTDPNGAWQLFAVSDFGADNNGADFIANGWSLRITTDDPAEGGLQANDDTFTVKASKTLKGAVLGNDVDAEGDALTAELIDGPKGSLQFAADGSFTYKAKKKAKGTDRFVYAASDGAATDQATVTIKIKKNRKGKK